MKDPDGLNDRQRRFVNAILAGKNATKAAQEAGYSPNSAAVTGWRLQRNANIAAAIAKGRQLSTAELIEVEAADDSPVDQARRGGVKLIGRKRIELPADAAQIVSMAAVGGATNRVIATLIGLSESALKIHFGPILTKRRAERRTAIARMQTKVALRGNVAMLIYLGKQPVDRGGLGQSDRLELGPKPDFTKWSTADLEAFVAGKLKPGKPAG